MADTPNTLAQLLADHQAQLQTRVEELSAAVKALPDNPAIKRPGAGQVNAFVVSSSDLFGAPTKAHKEAFPDDKRPPSSNWSPFFHDWKLQYDAVADLLRAQNFGTLATLLETGTLRARNGHNAEKFAPEVILALRKVIGELHKAENQVTATNPSSAARPRP